MEQLPLFALVFAGFLTGIYARSRTLASVPNFTSKNFKISKSFGYVAAIWLILACIAWISGRLGWSLLIAAIFAWIWVLSVLYDARNVQEK